MASFQYITVTGDPLLHRPINAIATGTATIVDDDPNLDLNESSGQFQIGSTVFEDTAYPYWFTPGVEIYTAKIRGRDVKFAYLSAKYDGVADAVDRIVVLEGYIDVGDKLTALKLYSTTTSIPYASIPSYVCFTPGTLIETDAGPVPVEDLAVGDRVLTRDNGYQVVRWTGRRSFSAGELTEKPALRPVRLRAGAMGQARPAADLVVSPQHRVLVADAHMAILYGEAEVLVAAEHLIDGRGITREPAGAGVTYIHFMFDRHEVVLSNGAWSESFNADEQSIGLVGEAQRAEILAIFPELARADGGIERRAMVRPVMKGFEAAAFAPALQPSPAYA